MHFDHFESLFFNNLCSAYLYDYETLQYTCSFIKYGLLFKCLNYIPIAGAKSSWKIGFGANPVELTSNPNPSIPKTFKNPSTLNHNRLKSKYVH